MHTCGRTSPGNGKVAELHARSAAWFADREHPDKAIDHVRFAGDDGPVVDLLRRHAATVLLTGDHERVRRAFTRLGAMSSPPAHRSR